MLCLVMANSIWGTTFVVTKPILERVPPITIAAGRFAIAAIVLLAILALTHQRPAFNRTTLAMAVLGVPVAYTCQNLGLWYTAAANASILHGGIPVFTMLIAAWSLRERSSHLRMVGLILSLGGVVTIVLFGSGQVLGPSLLGDGLVLLSGLGISAYLVLGRRAFARENPLRIVGGVAILGFLLLVPASVVEIGIRGVAQPHPGDLLGVAYLGIAASAVAFAGWAYGLRHFEAGQASTFANLSPLIGVIVAAVVLGESISVLQIGGGMLILGGVWLATRPLSQVVPPVEAGELTTTRRSLSTGSKSSMVCSSPGTKPALSSLRP
ncbi:MAG TPA: EamA family transporter [Thermomicrobiales bacterium]|nr:EamA family transporter [Thermomicrobiales bacterium]